MTKEQNMNRPRLLPEAIAIDGGYVVKRTPGRVHGTFASAGTEAARLTWQNPDGPAFMVLKVVGIVAPQDEERAHG